MGIFDRLSTLLKSNINDLISSAENPEKMLNQIIVDMRSQLAKAKQQVAAAIADERRRKIVFDGIEIVRAARPLGIEIVLEMLRAGADDVESESPCPRHHRVAQMAAIDRRHHQRRLPRHLRHPRRG